MVIVPLLTLAFGVDIRYAIGASLVSVIATSSGAAAAYVKEGFTNIRIGIFLEVATTIGALTGAFARGRLSTAGRGHRVRRSAAASAFLSAGRRRPARINSSPTRWPLVCGSTASIPALAVRCAIPCVAFLADSG